MNIGIDARLWGEEKNRGLGRYVKELVLNLEKIASSDDSFFIFLTKENFNDYRPSAPNFQKRLWNVPWYTLREQIDFRPLLKENLDLMHFPHWNVPCFYNQPFIATIHDLILLESDRTRQATTLGKARYTLKFAGFKMVLNHTLKKAKKIIAISQATRDDIARLFPDVAAKTEVIYQGISKITHGLKEILDKWKINCPYLLYVGSAYPHKNLEFLIKTFLEFNQENNNQYQLALVGQEDFFYQRLKNSVKDEQIIFTSQVSAPELGALYQNAALLINPSLIEGFGLPPLEALSLGTPVLVSDIPAFREILGENVAYFNPKDASSLKNALKNILNNPQVRTKSLESGKILQDRYSWGNCAARILALYQKICSERTK